MHSFPVFIIIVGLVFGVPAVSGVAIATGPLADAGLDQSVPVGTTVYLDATASRSPSGHIEEYRWDMDGPNASQPPLACSTCGQTSFVPTSQGTYQLTIEVTDRDGLTRTDTLTVTVGNVAPPSVSLSGPTTATTEPVDVTARVTSGTANLTALVWYRNGTRLTTADIAGSSATVTRPIGLSNGPNTVTVTAIDWRGHRRSASHVVSLPISNRSVGNGPRPDHDQSPPPVQAGPTARIDLTGPCRHGIRCDGSTIRIGETLTLDGELSTPGDAPIDTYNWEIGSDRNTSGVTQSASFSSSGEISAALTVTDTNGLTDTDHARISVGPEAWWVGLSYSCPVGDCRYVGSNDTLLAGPRNPIEFTSSSVGGPAANSSWTVDGLADAGDVDKITRSWIETGVYTVRATGTSPAGTTDTDSLRVKIRHPPSSPDQSGMIDTSVRAALRTDEICADGDRMDYGDRAVNTDPPDTPSSSGGECRITQAIDATVTVTDPDGDSVRVTIGLGGRTKTLTVPGSDLDGVDSGQSRRVRFLTTTNDDVGPRGPMARTIRATAVDASGNVDTTETRRADVLYAEDGGTGPVGEGRASADVHELAVISKNRLENGETRVTVAVSCDLRQGTGHDIQCWPAGTDGSVSIDWGDGSHSQSNAVDETETRAHLLRHDYRGGGDTTITATVETATRARNGNKQALTVLSTTVIAGKQRTLTEWERTETVVERERRPSNGGADVRWRRAGRARTEMTATRTKTVRKTAVPDTYFTDPLWKKVREYRDEGTQDVTFATERPGAGYTLVQRNARTTWDGWAGTTVLDDAADLTSPKYERIGTERERIQPPTYRWQTTETHRKTIRTVERVPVYETRELTRTYTVWDPRAVCIESGATGCDEWRGGDVERSYTIDRRVKAGTERSVTTSIQPVTYRQTHTGPTCPENQTCATVQKAVYDVSYRVRIRERVLQHKYARKSAATFAVWERYSQTQYWYWEKLVHR